MNNPNLILLVIIGGIAAGVNSGWGGLLSQVLEKSGKTQKFIGYSGFGTAITSTFGGIVIGVIADKYFPRHKKGLLISMFVFSAITFSVFTLMMPSPFSQSEHIIASDNVSICVLLIVAALFQGATDPLFYEITAEVTYPLPEGISAGLIVLIYNASTLIMLLVAPHIDIKVVNTI